MIWFHLVNSRYLKSKKIHAIKRRAELSFYIQFCLPKLLTLCYPGKE
jgi:hypothetical protein